MMATIRELLTYYFFLNFFAMEKIEKIVRSWFHFTELNFWRRLGGWLCLPLFVVCAIAFFAMPSAMPAEIGTADFVGRCVLQFSALIAGLLYARWCRLNCREAYLIDREEELQCELSAIKSAPNKEYEAEVLERKIRFVQWKMH